MQTLKSVMPKKKRMQRKKDRRGPLEESKKDLVRRATITDDMEEILTLTKSEYPEVRKAALKEICPCHVLADVEVFWARVFEMV